MIWSNILGASFTAALIFFMCPWCADVMDVLDKHLIPNASKGEPKVFYYKMKGDYHRYLAEFCAGDKRGEAAEKSLEAYKSASGMSY